MSNQSKKLEPVNLMNVKTSWNNAARANNDQYYDEKFQGNNMK